MTAPPEELGGAVVRNWGRRTGLVSAFAVVFVGVDKVHIFRFAFERVPLVCLLEVQHYMLPWSCRKNLSYQLRPPMEEGKYLNIK